MFIVFSYYAWYVWYVWYGILMLSWYVCLFEVSTATQAQQQLNVLRDKAIARLSSLVRYSIRCHIVCMYVYMCVWMYMHVCMGYICMCM